MKFNISLFRFRAFAELSLFSRSYDHTDGFSNRTQFGDYVVFLDFDNFKIEWLKDELDRLVKWFGLSHFIILRSGPKNYHAICLDRVPYDTYKRILTSCSVDPNFRSVPINASFKSWILRTQAKRDRTEPEFIEFLKGDPAGFSPVSKAHYEYMVRSELIPPEHRLTIYKYLKSLMDKSHKLYVTAYETGTKQVF